MDEADRVLWAELVAAERRVVEIRVGLDGRDARHQLLAAALDVAASAWDQVAALNYLSARPKDVVSFVPALFDLAVGQSREAKARSVLASGRRAEVVSHVRQLVAAYLPQPDPESYLHVASLLAALEDGEALKDVCTAALNSDSADVREAGTSISARYRALIRG